MGDGADQAQELAEKEWLDNLDKYERKPMKKKPVTKRSASKPPQSTEPAPTGTTGTDIVARPAALPADSVVRVLMAGDQMETAIHEYRELQKRLDRSMPDQLMKIKGKPFRKKGYWRAVRTAFGLSVERLSEERIVTANDWGYQVAYRAVAPNGNEAPGDGTCMASEKNIGGMRATEHNVRSHAHTRAFNRAVSNLVGFGEVSADEVSPEGYDLYGQGDSYRQQDYDDTGQEHLRQQQPKPEPGVKPAEGWEGRNAGQLAKPKPEPTKPVPQQPKQDGKLAILTKEQKELYEAVATYRNKWEPDVPGEQILIGITKFGNYPGARSVNKLSPKQIKIALEKLEKADAEQKKHAGE